MSEKPQHIGKYEVIAEVGKGGFDTVYKAVATTLDRVVGLKLLKPVLLFVVDRPAPFWEFPCNWQSAGKKSSRRHVAAVPEDPRV